MTRHVFPLSYSTLVTCRSRGISEKLTKEVNTTLHKIICRSHLFCDVPIVHLRHLPPLSNFFHLLRKVSTRLVRSLQLSKVAFFMYSKPALHRFVKLKESLKIVSFPPLTQRVSVERILSHTGELYFVP